MVDEVSGAWKQATFPIAVSKGGGKRGQIDVAGWTRSLFAIDERKNCTYLGGLQRRGKVWCISHLPTGYAVGFILGSRKLAMSLADQILAAADWNFDDPEAARSRGPAVGAVMKTDPLAFITGAEVGAAKPITAPAEAI